MQLSSRALESSSVFASPLSVIALPPVQRGASDYQARLQSSHAVIFSLENPAASAWCLSKSKRFLDLSFALLVLLVLAAPMLAIAMCVRLTSRGPAFFRQCRMGRGGRLFRLYKFRSMTWDADHRGPGLTRGGDCRITPLGRWLRKLKLDKLPQFYNVLRGEMSLVGPRPKLPRYTGIVNMPYRPGITGAATLAFRREEALLSRIHPSLLDDYYSQHIRPLKTRMDVRYMCRATFWSDLRLIGATFLACLRPSPTPPVVHHAPPQFFLYPPQTAQKGCAAKSFETAN
ncbi:MAG: sugar transferase [Terracidiphilus sp.]|jgi:lipopolysaccharide/colanic/teichoic acid biosynthesis glycosyltransferase